MENSTNLVICPLCGKSVESLCENCNRCEDCCNCAVCSDCGKKVDSVCDICDKCDDCCECHVCCICGKKVEELCSNCNRCFECCGCSVCSNCGDRVGVVCSNCGNCSSCCSCYCCDDCGEMVYSDNYCSECECCLNCCSCHSTDCRSMYIRQHAPFKIHTCRKNVINKCKRTIGVEIETSAVTNNGNTVDTINKWCGRIVEDSSIDGVEVVTAPASGDKFIQQIQEICLSLNRDEAAVDSKCGLHCHIGAKDFTWYDLRRLIKLYEKIEEDLYSMLATSRQDCMYCVRCGSIFLDGLDWYKSPRESKRKIIKNVYQLDTKSKCDAEGMKENKKHKYNYTGYSRARYYALNIQSWLYRGTIEFRAHQGTVSEEKIINWGLLLAAIVDYAYNHTEDEIDKLVKGETLLNHIVDSEVKNPDTANKLKTYISARKETFKNRRRNGR